jgi:hypothetical protein
MELGLQRDYLLGQHRSDVTRHPFGRRSGTHCLTRNVTGEVSADDWVGARRIGSVALMAGTISMGARREVLSAALPVGRAGSEGAHSRRVVPDDGL